MRLYVASSMLRKEDVKKIIAELKARGHSITFDWTLDENDGLKIGFDKAAILDMNGVLDAERIIVLHDDRGRGMATEVGIAIGYSMTFRRFTCRAENDIQLMIVGGRRWWDEEKTNEHIPMINVFYHLPIVNHYDTIEQVYEAL